MTTVTKRVLIVDDDPRIVQLLTEHFKQTYTVETAMSGGEALSIVARAPGCGGAGRDAARHERNPRSERAQAHGPDDPGHRRDGNRQSRDRQRSRQERRDDLPA